MEVRELSKIYERYGYLVRRRCLAIVGTATDADDALQEVFVRAQRHPGPEDPNATLRWLYTIADRCCFDLLRRRPKAELIEAAALDARVQGDSADADRRAIVGALLRSVGPRTREIALLALVDGYTQDEVANMTGYSRKTIGKKLKSFEERARRFLIGGGT